jgi:hypothetical protein
MIEKMKQWLKALEHSHANEPIWKTPHKEAIISLRQAIANEALNRMAENARELGLDYEPVPWIENMTIDSTNELSKPTTPVQKPVAWWVNSGHEGDVLFDEAEACRYALTINGSVTPFYTTPQPMREWVSLTVDEIWEVYKKHDSLQYMAFARAIEQSLKEKNT